MNLIPGFSFFSSPQNGIRQEHVMLNPFAFAPPSLRSGTSQAKLREASRSLNRGLVLS